MTLAVPIALVLASSAMTFLSILFLFHRGKWFQDSIIKFWAPRRRQILHLSCLNGYDFLRDKLHDWSLYPLIAATLASLYFFAPGSQLAPACSMVAAGFALRYTARLFVARSKLREASLPLEYDGFGSYARSSADWQSESSAVAIKAVIALFFTIVYALICAGDLADSGALSP